MADLMQPLQDLILALGRMFEAMPVPAMMLFVPVVVICFACVAVWLARLLTRLGGTA